MNHNHIHVLVTGGNGFIGSFVVRELLNRGIRVRTLSRNPVVPGRNAGSAAEFVQGDVRDAESVKKGMQGITHVVHAAACVASWVREVRKMYDVNVLGTKTVLQTAAEHAVASVVHVSSSSAITFRGSGVLDERAIAPRTLHLTDYGRSKALAEDEVRKMVAGGVTAVTIYPTRIFGVGTLTNVNAATRFLHLYLQGRLRLLPGSGNDVANWAFVEDVARGIVEALFHARKGERYILGGENATVREFFALADRVAGHRHKTIPLPHLLGRTVASMEEIRARVMRSQPRITRDWYEMIFENVQLSCTHAITDLGYAITPMGDAVSRVVRWLLEDRSHDS